MPPTIDTEQIPLADFNESDFLMESSLFLMKQSLVGLSKNSSVFFYGSFPISAISVLSL